MIVNLLAQLGSWVLSLLSSVGRFGIFSGRVLARLGGAGLSPIISQIHFIGNYSLLIISVSGLFVGFVLGLQGYYVLVTAAKKLWERWLRFRLCANLGLW